MTNKHKYSAEEFLKDEGIGRGTNITTGMCASLLRSYANQEVKKACKELREVEDKLHFMIDNGLGWKDMENDISPQD